MAQGYRYVTVKATGVEFDSYSKKLNIYYFHILTLKMRQSEAYSPSLNTQCLKNWVESGEGSVLTLGSQDHSAYTVCTRKQSCMRPLCI